MVRTESLKNFFEVEPYAASTPAQDAGHLTKNKKAADELKYSLTNLLHMTFPRPYRHNTLKFDACDTELYCVMPHEHPHDNQ